MSKNSYKILTDELSIDSSDMESNPRAFALRCMAKAKELAIKLDDKATGSEIEQKFKRNSLNNSADKATALKVKDEIYTILLAQTPAVLANLLTMMPELTQHMSAEIRNASFVGRGEQQLTKKHILDQYMRLRTCHEAFVTYMRMFRLEEVSNDPKRPQDNIAMIPSKSGNYSSGNSIKLHRVIIDGEVYTSPFRAAKILGLEVFTYMDVIDIIRQSDGTIGDYKVGLEEF